MTPTTSLIRQQASLIPMAVKLRSSFENSIIQEVSKALQIQFQPYFSAEFPILVAEWKEEFEKRASSLVNQQECFKASHAICFFIYNILHPEMATGKELEKQKIILEVEAKLKEVLRRLLTEPATPQSFLIKYKKFLDERKELRGTEEEIERMYQQGLQRLKDRANVRNLKIKETYESLNSQLQVQVTKRIEMTEEIETQTETIKTQIKNASGKILALQQDTQTMAVESDALDQKLKVDLQKTDAILPGVN